METTSNSVEGTFRIRNQHLSFFFDNETVLGLLMIAPAVVIASVTSPSVVPITALWDLKI
jgi:hypothetical protein